MQNQNIARYNNRARRNSGFTLVELSIVLVIIGLLIGGILAAQSMVSTAKVQSFTRQIAQYDIAVSNFADKFRALPGDYTRTGAVPGNGDNTLNDGTGQLDANAIFDSEIGKFWYDLSTSGLKGEKGAYVDNSNGAAEITTGTNIPAAVLGVSSNIVAIGVAAGQNNYVISNNSSANGGGGPMSNVPSIIPKDALAVDVKMDDGNPAAGNVLGSDSGNVAASLDSTYSNATACAASATTYKVLTARPVCSLNIRFGATNGQLQ